MKVHLQPFTCSPGVSLSIEAHLKTARIAAMDLLARREHSALEIQQKLASKFPEFDLDQIILPVISQLQSDLLQSDSRFAEAMVRYRSQRGMGPLKIMAELRPRGVAQDVLRDALYKDIDWVERCCEVLNKKFRVAAGAPAAEVARWQRFLAQRGFESEHCRQAIKQLGKAENEDF